MQQLLSSWLALSPITVFTQSKFSHTTPLAPKLPTQECITRLYSKVSSSTKTLSKLTRLSSAPPGTSQTVSHLKWVPLSASSHKRAPSLIYFKHRVRLRKISHYSMPNNLSNPFTICTVRVSHTKTSSQRTFSLTKTSTSSSPISAYPLLSKELTTQVSRSTAGSEPQDTWLPKSTCISHTKAKL